MVLKSRPVVTMAGIDQILEGRMAEWLRPRTSIAENGLNIRRISVGSILSLKEVYRRMVVNLLPVVTMAGAKADI